MCGVYPISGTGRASRAERGTMQGCAPVPDACRVVRPGLRGREATMDEEAAWTGSSVWSAVA